MNPEHYEYFTNLAVGFLFAGIFTFLVGLFYPARFPRVGSAEWQELGNRPVKLDPNRQWLQDQLSKACAREKDMQADLRVLQAKIPPTEENAHRWLKQLIK